MRRASSGLAATAALFGLVPLGCSVSQDNEAARGTVAQRVITSYNLTLTVPSGTTSTDFPVLAQDAVWLHDRVKVLTETGTSHVRIANLGQRTTELGADAETGNVTSKANVWLRERAHVFGALKTAGTLTRQTGTVIDGGYQERATITTTTSTRTVDFPTATGDISVLDKQTQTLPPGSYGRVAVYSGGTLHLGTGDYYVNALQIEPQAHVQLDTSSGLVSIYVKTELKYASAFENAGSFAGSTLLTYFGTADASLQAALQGTFMAPNAQATLTTLTQGVHTGAVFAKSIDIGAGVTLRHVPLGPRVQKKWSVAVPADTRFADMAVSPTGFVLGVTESLKVLGVSATGVETELSAGGPLPRHVFLHPQASSFSELAGGTMGVRSSTGSTLGQFTVAPGSHVLAIPSSQRLLVSDVVSAGPNAYVVQSLRVVEPNGATVSTIPAQGMVLMRAAAQDVVFLTRSNLVRASYAGSIDWQIPGQFETFQSAKSADRTIVQRLSSQSIVHYAGTNQVSETTLDGPVWRLAMAPGGAWSAAATANKVYVFNAGMLKAQAPLPTAYLTSLAISDTGDVLVGGQTADNQGRALLISSSGFILWQGETGMQDTQAFRPEVSAASNSRFYVRQRDAITAYDVTRTP